MPSKSKWIARLEDEMVAIIESGDRPLLTISYAFAEDGSITFLSELERSERGKSSARTKRGRQRRTVASYQSMGDSIEGALENLGREIEGVYR